MLIQYRTQTNLKLAFHKVASFRPHYLTFTLQTYHHPDKSRQNNLHSVHVRPCRIYEQSGPQNTEHCTTNGKHSKVLGLTLDIKLTYSTHIHNISVHAHKPLQIIKSFTATGWGKQKETRMATYKAVMRSAVEYASCILYQH